MGCSSTSSARGSAVSLASFCGGVGARDDFVLNSSERLPTAVAFSCARTRKSPIATYLDVSGPIADRHHRKTSMTELSENTNLQSLISITTHDPLSVAWRRLEETADPEEARALLAKILAGIFEAELAKQPLFREGEAATWHRSLSNLKAEYGLRRMVGVPDRQR